VWVVVVVDVVSLLVVVAVVVKMARVNYATYTFWKN